MHRRDFVGHLLRAGAAVAALPACARARMREEERDAAPPLELQLGPVTGELARDLEATLAGLRAAGITAVELPSPYAPFERSRAAVRAALDAAGVRAAGTLVGTGLLYRGWDRALDAAHALGCTRITCGAPQPEERRSERDWPELVDVYAAAEERARAGGLTFALRTEPWMFGTRVVSSPMDLLLAAPAGRRVGIALDVGSARDARLSLADLVQRLGARLVTVHLGSGDIADADAIAPLAHLAMTGRTHWIIAPDGAPGTPAERVRRPLDAARAALAPR